MVVPALASNPSTNGHIQGNVDLAPGVSMAPGVLLGASPGCRLVISTGVCLGADVVVQARQGDLVLEPGVSLGSGVLVVGHGSIGQHTCIGSNSTVVNPTLGASQVVAPGSLVGDPSQPVSPPNSSEGGSSVGAASPVKHRTHVANGNAGYGLSNGSRHGNSLDENAQYGTSNGNTSNGNTSSSNTSNGSRLNGSSVYGKTQVNHLLSTLFPHRQALNGATSEDKP
ncbi:hypothetical protein IQ273_00810 [Nodosilinea sp. LEGE 07298]|uniref:hypothetical protein n=1 Tax=Nodosilinea sp. LEGE 07298 TaxID=2777970 RepID=UPI0018827539|nr:hypothetical protein [Nodosilinea sp. LEGE 07298]MBE9107964.1 hypothetical protein [Nodosilinea sp. LEGE 07298]